MGRIGYLFKRLVRINRGRLGVTIARTAKKAGRSKAYIAVDMLRCAIKYTAAPADYDLFEFYNLTSTQRKTYVTRGVNDKLVKKFNDKNLWHIFDNKDEFNTVFARYIGREWIRLNPGDFSAFESFVKRHGTFFYKPLSLSCGWGIEKFDTDELTDLRAVFDGLCSRGSGLAEERIIQHPDMSAMFPGSVNTVRLVTINDGESAEVVFAFLRVGNGKVVDNLNSGGMAAPINPETGVVTHPAADKDYKAYTEHPATGTKFVGFQIPRFEQAVAMAKEASFTVPGMGYIGWDIAVTPDGLCFVEANGFPGHDILQLPPHVPDKVGLMARIEKYL